MIATTLNHLLPIQGWQNPYIERMLDGDYATVVLSYSPNGYAFNDGEAQMLNGKKIVVLDFEEYGWNRSWDNNKLTGFTIYGSDMYPGGYSPWHTWLSHQNIIAYFKRELTPEISQLNPPFPVYPLDLISQNRPNYEIQSKEQWMQRPADVMHVFGYSHEDRLVLENELKTQTGDLRVTIENVPHFKRHLLKAVLDGQQNHFFSTALPGCGHKTFRHSESCSGAIPVVMNVGMKFAVPWTNKNAVLLPTINGRLITEYAVASIEDELRDMDALYEKYLNAQTAANELNELNYIDMHINPHIKNRL